LRAGAPPVSRIWPISSAPGEVLGVVLGAIEPLWLAA